MAGTWPNLDAADLELRVRTYLHETTANFFTQTHIWKWLSQGVKDISQATTCVRRVLDSTTAAATGARTVTTNTYKVHHVEYVPTSGRPVMLPKITPLQVGHYPLTGITPQYWYENGNTIGIEPFPTTAYPLRLYVSDVPKMQHTTFPLTNTQFTAWTAGTGWTAATCTHTGSSGTLTEDTSILAISTNYTIEFTLTAPTGTFTSFTPALGDTSGVTVYKLGYHMQNITTSATAAPKIIFTGVGDVVVANLFIYKEIDFAAVGDQTELPCMWQHLLALYATYTGLLRDKRYGPAQMLESVYQNEIAYLRQNVIEVLPNGKNDLILNR